MKYSEYFGAKRRGFIKSESILAPKGASHFKNENIKCDSCIAKVMFNSLIFNHRL
jgi:alpha-amylase/alpha-mannosidase (GH57 family)